MAIAQVSRRRRSVLHADALRLPVIAAAGVFASSVSQRNIVVRPGVPLPGNRPAHLNMIVTRIGSLLSLSHSEGARCGQLASGSGMMSGVDTANLVLSYFRTLIWPFIVAMALILFRVPITALLGGIEEFEGFGIKLRVNQQVSRASADAQGALSSKTPQRTGGGRLRLLVIVAPNMRQAMLFTGTLLPGLPRSAPPQDRMRGAVERLDSVIVAVLAATAGHDDNDPEELGWPRLDADDVERYMVALTGWAGWGRIVSARNILMVGLVAVCGKRGKAVGIEEANYFEDVANLAIEALSTMVALVGGSVQDRR
jgi:hypothetical protein